MKSFKRGFSCLYFAKEAYTKEVGQAVQAPRCGCEVRVIVAQQRLKWMGVKAPVAEGVEKRVAWLIYLSTAEDPTQQVHMF